MRSGAGPTSGGEGGQQRTSSPEGGQGAQGAQGTLPSAQGTAQGTAQATAHGGDAIEGAAASAHFSATSSERAIAARQLAELRGEFEQQQRRMQEEMEAQVLRDIGEMYRGDI